MFKKMLLVWTPYTNQIHDPCQWMYVNFNFSLTTSDRCKYLGMLTLGVLWVAPKWQLFRNQKKNSQVSTSSFAFISSTMKVSINLTIVLSILREARILPLKQEHSIGDTFIKNKNKKWIQHRQSWPALWLWEIEPICIRTKFLSNFRNPLWENIGLQWKEEGESYEKKQHSHQNKQRSDGLAVDTHVTTKMNLQSLQCPSDQTRGFQSRQQTRAFPWGRPCFPERVTQKRAVSNSRTLRILHACHFLLGWQIPADLRFSCTSISQKQSFSSHKWPSRPWTTILFFSSKG